MLLPTPTRVISWLSRDKLKMSNFPNCYRELGTLGSSP